MTLSCLFAFVFKILILFFGCIVLEAQAVQADTPSVLYLTWMHDPATTMTVQWHTTDKDPVSRVAYRKIGAQDWQVKGGIYAPLPKSNLLIHTVELDELDPDGEYQCCFPGKKGQFRFRTLPSSLTRPIKFVVGGDAYFYLSTLRKMNQQIASHDPDFVVVGGDIAYTHGSRHKPFLMKRRGWELKRWRTFFQEWKSQMITSDGRMIPIMPVLGNHDIKPTALNGKSKDFLFYELFAFPEKGVPYRVLDAGDYLSLFLLDSGHSYHIGGVQTQWLKKSLSNRERVAYKMAAYHIAGYPSVYPYQSSSAKEIRAQWSPLFERYRLNVAFEHHNHAYKRTHPMKEGRIDPDGVTYMGDGSWGVTPRKPKKLWYLSTALQSNAVCLVTLAPEKGDIEAFDLKGEVIDSARVFPTQKRVAWDEGKLLQYH
jgi:hypothetical protein